MVSGFLSTAFLWLNMLEDLYSASVHTQLIFIEWYLSELLSKEKRKNVFEREGWQYIIYVKATFQELPIYLLYHVYRIETSSDFTGNSHIDL